MVDKKWPRSESFATPVFRVSYPNVFTPKATVEGGDPKYSVVMLFDKKTTDMTKMQAVVAQVIKDTQDLMHVDVKALKDAGKFRLPIQDGDLKFAENKEKYGMYAGQWYATADLRETRKDGTKNPPPQIILKLKKPDGSVEVKPVGPNDFYAGCYARAVIQCFYYDVPGNKGIKFSLEGLQWVRHGDRIGRSTDIAGAFEPTLEDIANAPQQSEEFDLMS